MSGANQRAQLSEFLRSCRARLSPSEIGLPSGKRRRTPGLRREDVASLAGLSSTWYTWLEQGRNVRASDRVLEKLSQTLRLSATERDYLFLLAQNRPAPILGPPVAHVPDTVKRTLDALNVPAQMITPRWDVVFWNRMVKRCIRDYDAMPAERRNLFRILMTGPEYRENASEFETLARRIVAKLRVDYSQAANDPDFDALIREMSEVSPMFRALWRSPEVSDRSEGVHLLKHPQLGGITFEHTSYVVEGIPTLRVVIFAPYDAESARKVAQLAHEEPVRRLVAV